MTTSTIVRVAAATRKSVPLYDGTWSLAANSANPKVPGSGAHGRYEAYRGCLTVGDFQQAYAKLSKEIRGSATAGSCLSWDVARGLVTIAKPTPKK